MNYISNGSANNNVLENYKVQSCPTYNRYTTDHKLFTMTQGTSVYYSEQPVDGGLQKRHIGNDQLGKGEWRHKPNDGAVEEGS